MHLSQSALFPTTQMQHTQGWFQHSDRFIMKEWGQGVTENTTGHRGLVSGTRSSSFLFRGGPAVSVFSFMCDLAVSRSEKLLCYMKLDVTRSF